MRNIERWLQAVTFTLVLVLPLAWLEFGPKYRYEGPVPDLAAVIAREPAGWQAKPSLKDVIDPRWDAFAQAAYDSVVMRQYVLPDRSEVTLVLTWSRDGRQRAGHHQENCYRVQGFTVSDERKTVLPTSVKPLDATTFTARRESVVEEVVYWRVTGGVLESSAISSRKLSRLRETMTRRIPENVMVRISTRRPANAVRAVTHEALVQTFLQSLKPADLAMLTGK